MTNKTEDESGVPAYSASAEDLLHGLLINQANLGQIGADLVSLLVVAGVEPNCSKPPCKHSTK